jgi:hypothetical protein
MLNVVIAGVMIIVVVIEIVVVMIMIHVLVRVGTAFFLSVMVKNGKTKL